MRCITKVIEHGSRSDVFRIIPIGDTHLGHTAVDEELVRRTVEKVKEDNTYWIGLGDTVDGIGRMDRRHREESLAKWCHGTNRVFDKQRKYAAEVLGPIGNKCLGYVKGNHEEYLETTGIDLYLSTLEDIVGEDSAGQLAIGMSGYIILKFPRLSGDKRGGTQTYTIFVHHGAGGGQLIGSKAIKLERLPATYEADIYIIGHTHTKIAFPTQRIVATRNGKLETRDQWLCNTGGFMHGAVEDTSIYSERKMLKPQSLGSVEIELRPGAEDFRDRVRIIL